MGPRLVRRHCSLEPRGQGLLQSAVERLGLSTRGFDRVLRVARTCADLAGAEQVAAEHVAEAIHYRALEREVL
jgi:magnesium chelatase family protein